MIMAKFVFSGLDNPLSNTLMQVDFLGLCGECVNQSAGNIYDSPLKLGTVWIQSVELVRAVSECAHDLLQLTPSVCNLLIKAGARKLWVSQLYHGNLENSKQILRNLFPMIQSYVVWSISVIGSIIGLTWRRNKEDQILQQGSQKLTEAAMEASTRLTSKVNLAKSKVALKTQGASVVGW